MSNVITEGFGVYGLGANLTSGQTVSAALLGGVWASVPSNVGQTSTLQTLSWDPTNLDPFMFSSFGGVGSGSGSQGWRRVLPAALTDVRFSFYYAAGSLPVSGVAAILDFANGTNLTRCSLRMTTTGALTLHNASSVALITSSGPVVAAETLYHFECRCTTAGVFQLYVNDTLVLDGSGLTYSNTGDFEQFRVLSPIGASTSAGHYMGHLIVRNSSGSYNNTFPIGDRKVATLLVNRDDADDQGWTGEPLRRFGVGILQLTTTSASVIGPATTSTDLGSGDFTLEGQFRFSVLPTGSNKATLFGKWDEPANRRSYQLFLGGPSLDTGLLVFRTSTDGANGTVVDKVKWDWNPEVGVWYHIAMCRDGGDLKLFIDGVLQGIAVTDGDTYFAGAARPAIGAQTNGAAAVANTTLTGWQDEYRFTKGLSRYTANFTPPTEGFPRNGDDPDWASVIWLSSWDNAVVADDGPLALALTALNTATAITPNDGDFNYQVLNKDAPFDSTFITADLVAATSLFTLTALPTDTETVTVGTTDGATPAVYTFKNALTTSFQVLIGVSIAATMANFVAAVIHGAGEGTVYGTGTTANADVTAALQPSNQLLATALTPGTVGNAVATTDTCANGSWTGATLAGGEDIPDFSQFGFQRLPAGATVADSITFANRVWKTDAGPGTVQFSLVGPSGGVENGTPHAVGGTPSTVFDVFEEDPDTSSTITPTTVLNALERINRTL